MEYPTLSQDSEQLIPLILMALSRGMSLRPTYEQSSNTSGRIRERLEDAHGSATPRPPESMRPAATPPEGPSVAAKRWWRDAPAAGLLSFPKAAALVRPTPRAREWTLPLATALSPPLPPAYHHQSSTCLRRSVTKVPKRVDVTQASHNRIAHFVLVHHFVGLHFCLLVPVSIVTDEATEGGTCPGLRRPTR